MPDVFATFVQVFFHVVVNEDAVLLQRRQAVSEYNVEHGADSNPLNGDRYEDVSLPRLSVPLPIF